MPYSGQLAEIPAGRGTLISDNNSARARYIDLIVAEGIISSKGVWEREAGATPYVNSPVSSGLTSFSFSARSLGAGAVFASFRLLGSFQYLGLSTPFQFAAGPTANATVGDFGTIGVIPPSSAIVICITRASGSVLSITDGAGNTYAKIGAAVFGAASTELWVAYNVVATPAGTAIAFTFNAPHGIAAGSVHVVSGITAVDAVYTATAAPGAVALSQASPFILQDQNEALLCSYGDADSVLGVVVAPSEVTASTISSAGIGNQLFYSPLPFASQAAANALADYWINPVTQRLLALASDGYAYKSSGAEFSRLTMATVMSDVPGSMIVVGGQETAGAARKAFFFNGITKIQTLTGDGVATTNFGNDWNTTTNIPIDWASNPPRGGIIHKERLWCWAPANAPHTIYASALGNHEMFKNAVGGSLEYVQELGTGVGENIAACASFKGMLFAFKYPRGVFYLDDTDVDYLNWRWNLATDAVGVANSPNAVLVLDDDVLFVDSAGHFHFLSAITTQGVTSSDLSAQYNLQQWTQDNMSLLRLNQMASAWYPAEKIAVVAMPSLGSTVNDLRMYLDFSNATEEGQVVRISYSHRDVTRAMTIRRDTEIDGVQRPLWGENTGMVWKWSPTSKIKAGMPNAGQVRYQYTPTNMDFVDATLANKEKIWDALTITYNPSGNWNLTIDTILDGRYHESLYFDQGGPASILGTFQFGQRLGGGSITTSRRRMTGASHWLSLAGWVQGEGHDFSVANHIVNFRVGGEKVTSY